jgi:hypothetical protein
MRRTLAFALVLPLLALPASSRADDAATAQALHDEAKALIADGKWSAACPKLEESFRLSPAIGTRYKLADCYQHTGRSASAWAHFVGVASTAKAAGQTDREKEARARAAALEPKLSRLAIVVPDGSRANGLEIKRDGEVVGAPQWGAALPIDPGAHEVVASAPGMRVYRAQIDVAGDASTTKVIIPPLDAEAKVEPKPDAKIDAKTDAPATTTASPPPPPPEGGLSRSTVGWGFVGGGGLALVGGTVFWILRSSKVSTLEGECGASGHACPASASGDIADGKTYNALGVGMFALGTACIAIGAGVLITGRDKDKASATTRIVPVAGNAPGVSLAGSW